MVMALTVAVVSLMSVDPVRAQSPGVLRGTVAGASSGEPLATISVVALHWFWGVPIASTSTGPDGSYALDLPAGSYRVRFTDPAGARADRYSGGTPDWAGSSAIVVSEGSDTVADASLPLRDTVGGTVTGDGSAPLAGIRVEAVDQLHLPVASTTTAPDGTYALIVGPGAVHTVRFVDLTGAHGARYAGGAPTFAGATTFATTGGQHHTVDMTLDQASHLTGAVRVGKLPIPANAAEPVPDLSGLYVGAFDAATTNLVGLGVTAGDGTFDVAVASGTYKVAVIDARTFDPAPSGYRPQFVPAQDVLSAGLAAAWAGADPVPVPPGTTVPVGTQVLAGWDCDPTALHPAVVLAGADLTDLDLRGCDLADTDVTGAQLAGTDLAGADLSGADLHATDLARTSLVGADLRGADLSGALLVDSGVSQWLGPNQAPSFRASSPTWGTHLAGADLSDATVWSGQLLDADPDWTGIDLTGAREPFPAISPIGTACWQSGFCSVVWVHDSLFTLGFYEPARTWIELWTAQPVGDQASVQRHGTPLVLTGARVTDGARMGDQAGADLSDLRCRGCRFAITSSTTSDLTGANLTGADLTDADLRWVDLMAATVDLAVLDRADFANAVGTPTGGASAGYDTTRCPDLTITDGSAVTSCVGHGFAP